MFLKKINPNLAKAIEEAGLTEANEIQRETWSTIKSGADAVICAPKGEGKTTTIVITIVQRLEKPFEESPRALIIVENKSEVLAVVDMFRQYNNHNGLRVYGVYEQGDIDYDKNQISLGIDVLVGTPGRLNEMFSTAGFDVNRLKMFIVDEAETLLKNRMETKIVRISDSITKTQRLFFTDVITDRVEILADRIMIEPLFFEFDDEGEGEEEDEII